MAEKNASHGVLTSRSAEWWPGVKLQCYCCEFTVLLLLLLLLLLLILPLLLLLLLVAFLPVNLNSFATQSRIYHLVQEGGPRPKRFLSGIFGQIALVSGTNKSPKIFLRGDEKKTFSSLLWVGKPLSRPQKWFLDISLPNGVFGQ